MSDRYATTYNAESQMWSNMLVNMLELGHRAWYALETGEDWWVPWTLSTHSPEDAPASGAS